MSRTSILFALFLAMAGPLLAADIHVDASAGDDTRAGTAWSAPVRTIARALALAQAAPGADTIHVAAGRYAENVLVPRGDVTLLGGYPPGGGTRDPAVNPTIVDGGGTAPALTISGGSGRVALAAITVDGFTFTNGAALGRAGIFGGGAGVFVEEAAVVLTNNVIASNTIRGDGLLGAGLYLYRLTAGPSRIEDNAIHDNRAENGLGGGAAIVDFADPSAGRTSFTGNDVHDNRAVALPGGDPQLALAQGGGVFAWGGGAVLANNRIASNVAESRIAADYSGSGGGIYVLDGGPTISNNVITANVATADTAAFGAAGGGVYAWWGQPGAGAMLVQGNQITANRAAGVAGPDQATGGGIALSVMADAAPSLADNVVSDNVADGDGVRAGIGGGVFAYVDPATSGSVSITGGSVERNQALDGGGGLWLQDGAPRAVMADGVLIASNEADFGSGAVIFGDGAIVNSRVRLNRVYDPDGDAVSEIADNCPGLSNPVQSNADPDGLGDACDPDDDDDGVPDASDACPLVPGASCAGDRDGDTVGDGTDNCPDVANLSQSDATLDGVGDACEPAQFDALETNAGGIWVTGDATLVNDEVVRNAGQGLLLIGSAASGGNAEDPASVSIVNLTIAQNDAAGFITYLADGTSMRDTIVAMNALSDGFDTERSPGVPSSPDVACDDVYYYDGIASLPCNGAGNLDFTDGAPAFVTGFYGDHYLAQAAAGDPSTFVGVDAGSGPASASPVAGRTTRTDAVADSGAVDLGCHYASPPVTFDDPLATTMRVAAAGGRLQLSLVGAPTGITAVRWYRGDVRTLQAGYSHRSPFSGQAGDPECSAPPAVTIDDSATLGDGFAWYYLVVDVTTGTEGTFGRRSDSLLRTRPEDSATDPVTNACP